MASTVNILLSGARGRMGRAVASLAENSGIYKIAAGIDINEGGQIWGMYPVFTHPADLPANLADSLSINAVIDFSHHTAAESLLDYAVAHRLPTVVATTGHTPEELQIIKGAAAKIPVFYSRNMSLGVNLVIELCRRAASALRDFDIEIIEKHHNKKLDAPSGTALMIADAISETANPQRETEYVYDRSVRHGERIPGEIGIHSVRGGTIVGEHEVMFAGHDEIVTISHSAASRDVFARGALRAASFIIDKPAGLYNMNDIVNSAEL